MESRLVLEGEMIFAGVEKWSYWNLRIASLQLRDAHTDNNSKCVLTLQTRQQPVNMRRLIDTVAEPTVMNFFAWQKLASNAPDIMLLHYINLLSTIGWNVRSLGVTEWTAGYICLTGSVVVNDSHLESLSFWKIIIASVESTGWIELEEANHYELTLPKPNSNFSWCKYRRTIFFCHSFNKRQLWTMGSKLVIAPVQTLPQ